MKTQMKKMGLLAVVAVAVSGLALSVHALADEHGRGFGPEKIRAHIERVLSKLNATDAQKQQLKSTEDKLIADLEAQRQAHQAIMKELRAQIGSDTVNLATFDQLVASQKQAEETLRGDFRASIQTFHDTLSPAQRTQFSQMKMFGGFHGKPETAPDAVQ